MKAYWALLSLLLLAFQNGSTAVRNDGTDELLNELPILIERQREAWHVPGLAVAVVKDGNIIFLKGFGYRDREEQLPVTTKTLFPIASCSKAFTALTAAIAQQDGLLDWDIPLRNYVPGFEMIDAKAAKKASLTDFLRHRSGYGDYRYLPWLSGATRDEVLARLKYLEPEAKFRKKLVYSNIGYTIAGYAVGAAAGTTWEAFTEKRIFGPLEMSSTGFTVADMERSGDYAVGYLNILDPENPRRHGVSTLNAFSPAGGIVSNIEDMAKWLLFNMGDGTYEGRPVTSRDTIERLHTPHTDLSSNPDGELVTYQGYGYGWWSETYRGYTHVYHGGLGNGYISQVSFLPEEKIGVVVLTNLYYAHLHQALVYHVLDRLLGLEEVDHFGRELKGLGAYMTNWLKDYNAFWDGTDGNSPPSRALEEYEGQYANPAFGKVSVDFQDGELELTFESGISL